MANAYGDSGGRSGPYWRRQMGTTLPGERTGAQLHILNMARARLGLPPVGGAIGDNTRVAVDPEAGPHQLPAGAIDRRRSVQPGGHPRFLGPPQRTAMPSDNLPGGDTFQPVPPISQIPEQPGNGGLVPLPQHQFGRPAFLGGNDHSDLRARLLAQFQGRVPMQGPGVSRDALRQYVQQFQQRRAMPGPQKPVLPGRSSTLRRAIPY